MAPVDLLAISVVFAMGVVTGIVLLVSLASRREDRRVKLSREAPDRIAKAGRLLTNLYVRRPGDDRPEHAYPDDDRAEFNGPPRGDSGPQWPRPSDRWPRH
jgi:hypothetical protein